VFSQFEKNIVMEPNLIIMDELEPYYASYGIDPYDDNLFNY